MQITRIDVALLILNQAILYLQTQHTPNPDAHEPSLVPPNDEHSSLKTNKYMQIADAMIKLVV